MEIPDEIRPSEQRSFHIPKHNLLPDMISEKASPDEKIEGEPLGDPAAVNPTEGHLLLPNRLHTKVVDYDDYALPANLRYAEIHGRVTMAGNLNAVFNLRDPFTSQKLPNYDKVKDLPTEDCPCCKKINVIGEKVSLLTKTIHLGSLGTAIPGFFEFAKFTVYIYSACLVTYSLYLMVTYGLAQFCIYGQATTDGGQVKADNSRYACGDSWKFFFTGANGAANLTDIWERLIWVGTVLILFVIKAFYYRKFRKIKSESEAITTDITDYTVEVRGLPQDICKKDIIDFFAKQELKDDDGKVVPLRVQLINFVYEDVKNINKMNDTLNEFIEDFLTQTTEEALHKKKAKEGDSFDEEKFISSFDDKMNVHEDQYNKLLQEGYTVPRVERTEVSHFAGDAFVSFETKQQAEIVRKHMQIRSLGKLVNRLFGGLRGPFRSLRGAKNYRLPHKGDSGPYFYIESAIIPGELIWESRGYWRIVRYLRQSISALLNLAFIVATFFLILYLKDIEFSLDPTLSSTRGMSIGITVCIKISGLVCNFLSEILVSFSLPLTTTARNISTIWRITVSMFFNSAVILVFSNAFLKNPEVLKKSLYLNTGLINDLEIMLYLSGIEVLLAFVDPSIILKAVKRCRMKSKSQDSTLVQKVMNGLYEGGNFDYPVRFAKYLNLMMLTFFMVKTVPLAPAFAIVLTFLFYWADKIFLLRWSKIPEVCSIELAMSMLRFWDLAMVIWTFGYIAWDTIEFAEPAVWTYIQTATMVGLLVIDTNYFMEKFLSRGDPPSIKEERPLNFIEFLKKVRPDTYEVVNPVDKIKHSLALFAKPGFLKQMRIQHTMHDKNEKLNSDLDDIMKEVMDDIDQNEKSVRPTAGAQVKTEPLPLQATAAPKTESGAQPATKTGQEIRQPADVQVQLRQA